VLMSGIAGSGAAALSGYLFGSLTTVTRSDLIMVGVLALVVLVPAVGLAPQLFAVCTDEDFARVQGLPVRFYNIMIVALAAITVTLAMRTVGLLLVSALMVVPVAAASNLVRGFYAALGCAMVVGVLVSVGGAAGAYYADTAPGALIVVLAILVFVLTLPASALLRRRQQAALELPESVDDDKVVLPHVDTGVHPHQHGPGCGHPYVQHGDHTDFIHEGHRHAQHADHYDEH
jgi:zinc transport system permease protein